MIEIVNIEKTAYDKFVGQFEGFVKKMTEMAIVALTSAWVTGLIMMKYAES